MLNFVKDRGRAASPQNDQNGHPSISARRQAAANTKVSTKKGALAQEVQAHSVIPTRGLGNVQNSSAVVHHRVQHQPSGQGHHNGQDPFDTDAESLDTTTNPSVVKVEDSQTRVWQHQQIHRAFPHSQESEREEEEIEDDEDENQSGHYEITEEGFYFLQENGISHIVEQEQHEFLEQHFPSGLRAVKGDSYPSTTNGHPTELEEDQERPYEDDGDGEQSSPSPKRPIMNAQLSHPIAPQPIKQEPVSNQFGATKGIRRQPDILQKSASIRAQDRSSAHQARPKGQHTVTGPPTSQPPSYSQSNPRMAPNLLIEHHESLHGHVNRHPPRVQLRSPQPHVSSKRPNSVHSRVEPGVQPQPPQPTLDDIDTTSVVDYEPARLFTMKYDQLKNENFDTNPRADASVVTDDILQKPLVERLEFVQKNLDAAKQSSFFSSLPTTEWEDAGDWFLDQFQSIIQRTKKARQQKRKLAQEFEDEVEKRHNHVSKKQGQVQQAMDKMKVQGEGLVPRSPRPSNSPRPKKG